MKKNRSARRIFAIGDVHGCAQELEALLRKLRLKGDDLVVFLGDYVDRGPDSRRVVDIILDLAQTCEVVALKGNHEAMFLDFLNQPESPGAGLFVLNGGTATLARYMLADGSIEIPDAHLEFFKSLKLFHETDDYFFVHAGVPNQPLATLNAVEHEMHMLWSRFPFLNSEYHWEKLVVHGHTPVSEVEILANRINLDTGCVYDGKLTAMEFPLRKLHSVEKGIKQEPVLFPKELESARISTRFSGRLQVELRLRENAGQTNRDGAAPFWEFETMNYNQFGMLIKAVDNTQSATPSSAPNLSSPRTIFLAVGDEVEGRVLGAALTDSVGFQGAVVRSEARGSVTVYGVRIDRLASDADHPKGKLDWFDRLKRPNR